MDKTIISKLIKAGVALAVAGGVAIDAETAAALEKALPWMLYAGLSVFEAWQKRQAERAVLNLGGASARPQG